MQRACQGVTLVGTTTSEEIIQNQAQVLFMDSNFVKICRCCLAEGSPQDVYEKIEAETLKDNLNLFLTEDLQLPPLMCPKCSNFLREVKQFRETVVTSHIKLMGAIMNRNVNKDQATCETTVKTNTEIFIQNELVVKKEIEINELCECAEPLADTEEVVRDTNVIVTIKTEIEAGAEMDDKMSDFVPLDNLDTFKEENPPSTDESAKHIKIEIEKSPQSEQTKRQTPLLKERIPKAGRSVGRPKKSKGGRPKTSPLTRSEQIREAAARYRNKRREKRKQTLVRYNASHPEVNQEAASRPEVNQSVIEHYTASYSEVNIAAVAQYAASHPEVNQAAVAYYTASHPEVKIEAADRDTASHPEVKTETAVRYTTPQPEGNIRGSRLRAAMANTKAKELRHFLQQKFKRHLVKDYRIALENSVLSRLN